MNKDNILLNNILSIKLDTNTDNNDNNKIIEEIKHKSEIEEDKTILWKCAYYKKRFQVRMINIKS